MDRNARRNVPMTMARPARSPVRTVLLALKAALANAVRFRLPFNFS
jgi:hypothetical protein